MKFYVNTDTVDIENKQIGIHFVGTVNREFCAGVNHVGTRESVKLATEIARLFAAAPEMLEALKEAIGELHRLSALYDFQPEITEDMPMPDLPLISQLETIISKIERK